MHSDLHIVLTYKYISKFDMYVFIRKQFFTCHLGVYFSYLTDNHRYIASPNGGHVEHALPS